MVALLLVLVCGQALLDLLEAGCWAEPLVPGRVAFPSLVVHPQHGHVAWLARLRSVAKACGVLGHILDRLRIARKRAPLAIHVLLSLVQEGLKLGVAGLFGEPLVPLRVDADVLLGESHRLITSLTWEGGVARGVLSLLKAQLRCPVHTARQRAHYGPIGIFLAVQEDLHLLEGRLLRKSRVPLRMLRYRPLGVYHPNVALVAGHGRVASAALRLSP
mmetsp:Transcript_90141/g.193260  ORF Transcript_90141/g.193260 Transcript_90141/m.193260 type:complete len:217 (-) Transcript_90141:796-1446(-)